MFQPRKAQGQLLSWYVNGKRCSVKNYEDGLQHGLELEWYENDSLRHLINYKEGEYDGELKVYHNSGALKREERYADGKQIGGRCFQENGEEVACAPYREMPAFPGGEEEMFRFLGSNVRYPARSQRAGISGEVLVSFLVGVAGGLSDIRIEKGLNEELSQEAVRVIKKMPRWKPGTFEGEEVSMRYVLPIRFVL